MIVDWRRECNEWSGTRQRYLKCLNEAEVVEAAELTGELGVVEAAGLVEEPGAVEMVGVCFLPAAALSSPGL